MILSASQTKIAELNKSQPFFVSGIGQHKTVDAAKLCGGADNVAKVEVQQTFVNGLLSVVTFGVYTPRQARVFCK
ncbi:Bor family protein [Photobacterium carnosum]|uniref:Bor family protein n=1 Tax=Photobacterium carnosum TaxID=2023717 RepID=UPI0039F6C6E8|nr:lipoprotein bor [Photobacterium carnosum]